MNNLVNDKWLIISKLKITSTDSSCFSVLYAPALFGISFNSMHFYLLVSFVYSSCPPIQVHNPSCRYPCFCCTAVHLCIVRSSCHIRCRTAQAHTLERGKQPSEANSSYPCSYSYLISYSPGFVDKFIADDTSKLLMKQQNLNETRICIFRLLLALLS